MASQKLNEPFKAEKMAKLPSNAKVMKRPIMHPTISSPYAGARQEKIIYISSKMPFMSAATRVKKLLAQIDKREMQAVLDARNKKDNDISLTAEKCSEPVIVKATGKAIPKALSLGCFFQKQPEYIVMIQTSSIDAIDDIEPGEEDINTDQDLPECRIRHISVIEVLIRAR